MILIFKSLFNLRDYKQTKAYLNTDGCSIMIKEPAVVTYMTKDLKKMHELDGTEMCATILMIKKMVASEIDDTKNHSEKTIELCFPADIACNADNYNYGGGRSSRSGKLKNYCHMMETVVSKDKMAWIFSNLLHL